MCVGRKDLSSSAFWHLLGDYSRPLLFSGKAHCVWPAKGISVCPEGSNLLSSEVIKPVSVCASLFPDAFRILVLKKSACCRYYYQQGSATCRKLFSRGLSRPTASIVIMLFLSGPFAFDNYFAPFPLLISFPNFCAMQLFPLRKKLSNGL